LKRFSIFLAPVPLQVPCLHLLLLASATGIGGTFQYGFNISDIKNFINNTYCERYGMFIDENLVTLLWSVMVSIYTAGGALGSFLTGPLASKLGSEVMSVTLLCTGLGLNLQPMYLGEMAPQHLRGVMSICGMILLPIGITFGQVVGLPEILGWPGGWPLILSITAIPALLQICTLPWCPESPRFLLIDKNDVVECRKGLFQQPFRGRHGDIASGVAPEDMAYIAIGTGLCELLALLMSTLLIERLGRKPLLIGGYSMMALSCVIITISLSLQEHVYWMPFLSASCVFACILSFGIGPGCITSMLPAEFFTQEARSGAYTLYGMSNWSFRFIIGMVFPFMVEGLGPFCFIFFLIDCVATAIFIFFFIPETKNHSFLEIASYFQRIGDHRYVQVQQCNIFVHMY
uniref:Solute carrier family 2 member 11a n=1 Tax=Eptatretus burgeri TaxID=7764 RepID=A0A8C4R6G9_EPTBU